MDMTENGRNAIMLWMALVFCTVGVVLSAAFTGSVMLVGLDVLLAAVTIPAVVISFTIVGLTFRELAGVWA